MPQEKGSNHDSRANEDSTRHAQWVREHPRIDDSAFPEYPDELLRRGASRGAVPNGNPWHAIDPHEKPGQGPEKADPFADTMRISTAPDSDGAPTLRTPVAPRPSEDSASAPAVVSANTEADERIGRDIGEALASAKSLEGTHLLVEVVDGEVYLHGTVADQAVRSEVEQLASSVRRAKEIHNELDVRSA